MTWFLAGLSLYATWLNARKVRWCFALWAVTNTAWAAVNLTRGVPARGCLDACYAALAVYGWRRWR